MCFGVSALARRRAAVARDCRGALGCGQQGVFKPRAQAGAADPGVRQRVM